MSNESTEEKTEQPSEKRLKEAKEKGQVIRSKDFNSTMALLFSAASFFLLGKPMTLSLLQLMRQSFEFDSQFLMTPWLMLTELSTLFKKVLWAFWPLMAIIFTVTLLSPVFLGGFLFSTQLLQPKFSRLSMLQGLKRMLSLKQSMEMFKAFLKFLLVAVVAFFVLRIQVPTLLALVNTPVKTASYLGIWIVLKSFLWVSASLLVIAAIDVPFQWYMHQKELRMTKQELKDEYKDTEGKPEVRSAIRRIQQEMSRRRMMSDVPKANVIVTNPTHYAVALKYQEKGNKAPIVVAKGKNLVAFQINDLAKENKIPILSVPPLARALYFSTKLNAEIPRGLYVAVAQVLAYVFQLRDKTHYDTKPHTLQDVPIPDDLARDADKEDA